MEIKDFGRIGVLMGGPSTERKISLKSGEAVLEALKQSGLDASGVDIKTDNIQENINLISSQRINCAFIALHGRFGEDGQIQEILEALKIPYTGSGVEASKLAMDKIASRKIFEVNGLCVPRYKVINKFSSEGACVLENGLPLPLVIKPASNGSSIGLSIINKEEELKGAMDLAFEYDERIIIEEYVRGREVTVGILDDAPLPVIEIVPRKQFFDYEAKYQPGLTDYIVPAELEERVSRKVKGIALSAHRLLRCWACSRADIILNERLIPVILEVNTIPGFTATSLLPKAAKNAGVEFNQLCLKLIKLAYEKKAF